MWANLSNLVISNKLQTIRIKMKSQFACGGFIIMLFLSMVLTGLSASISPDNACTFRIGGKLFSLLYLQKQKPYQLQLSSDKTIYINFCSAFTPPECNGTKTAYSFIVTKSEIQKINQNNDTIKQNNYSCERYSSNYYGYLFTAIYIKNDNLGILKYTQLAEQTQQPQTTARKQTVYEIQCTDEEGFEIEQFRATQSTLWIRGQSVYGCPVFQVSNIWKVFEDNWIIIGLLMIVLGLHLLFFGRVTIETTIFIAGFLICFAVLGSMFTLFVGPYSSTFVIYLAFLLLLFASTMLGYGITKLVNVSIFFVGAILGFIIGMLVNSLFCKIFSIYSVWSLVVFEIVFTIPFGLLSFKYRDQIIIASSSLTGAYFIVRPISWIFGGFPNQFLLYHMIETGQLNSLPWMFFIYLILIIALAILGAMYQLIKLNRQNPLGQLEINFIQESIEQPIDRVKAKVDKLIERFQSDQTEGQDYRKMSQLKQNEGPRRKSENVRQKEELF